MSGFHQNENIYVDEIVLKTKDINKSRRFYKNIMGLKELKKEDNKVVFSINGSKPILTLITSDNIKSKIPKRTGLYHYALLLPNRYYLGLFIKNLQDKSYPITGASDHGVSEAIYFKDPDDNGIEVYSDFDSSEWNKENDQIKMVTRSLDYEELINKTGKDKWEGIPKETIIGHIHLHVDDLLKAKEFYVKGLGLNVMQKLRDSALFLSTGGYHHHIALNTWNGVGVDSLPKNSAGMKYFSIHFPDDRSRNESIEKIRKLGYEINRKQNNIFVKDPANNVIKLVID